VEVIRLRDARIKNDWRHVDRALSPFDASSVLQLLSAACDSPGAGHRLPSASALWLRTVRKPPTGHSTATASSLGLLLDAARQGLPGLAATEDCWLADPRLDVRFDVNATRLRVHPGPFTDPIAVLRTVEMVAKAADERLLDVLGFGLVDVLEVALRHTNDVTSVMAPHWLPNAGARDRPDPPNEDLLARIRRISYAAAVVSDEEMSARALVHTTEPDWLRDCATPPRAARALSWMTTPVSKVSSRTTSSGPVLGRALRLQQDDRYVMIPAALTLSALLHAAVELAAIAAPDREANLHLRALASIRIAEVLDPASDRRDDLVQGVPRSALAESFGVVRAPRHLVLGEIVAALDQKRFSARLDEANHALSRSAEAQLTDAGDLGLSGQPEVLRVLVCAGPFQAPSISASGIVTLHLTELETLFDDALESEDLELVWQFLEDVTASPQVLSGPADLLDAWRHWRAFGAFDPSCSGRLVLVDPTPDQLRWQASSRWEPIEAVLTSSRLGARRHWGRSVLDGPGVATLVGDAGHCMVVADPPFVVMPEAGDDIRAVGVDPSLVLNVASGMRWLLATDVRTHELIRLVDSPVVCRLAIDGTRPNHVANERIAVATAAHPSHPWFSIRLGLDWLEVLQRDPEHGHAVVGEVLAQLLLELQREQPINPDELRASFTAAWRTNEPLLLVRHEHHPASDAGELTGLRRNQASKRRAMACLAAEVARRSVSPGTYVGEEAARVAVEFLTPAAEQALDLSVADWSPTALRSVLGLLNRDQWRREVMSRGIEFGLIAPWADEVRETALAQLPPSTRALELLTERLLLHPPGGEIDPDRVDVASVVDLSELVLSISLIRSGSTVGLHGAAVDVLQTGVIRIEPDAAGPDEVDTPALFDAIRAHPLRTAQPAEQPQPLYGSAVNDKGELAFQSISSAYTESLRVIDGLLQRDLGCSIDALIAVLATAASIDVDADGLRELPRSELVRSASQWSQVDTTLIEAASALLTLTPQAIQSEGHDYWQVERRSHRLTVRPLIEVAGDVLLIAPHCVRAAQRLVADALLDGRLPWPKRTVSRDLVNALARHRQSGSRATERAVVAIAAAESLPHAAKLEPHKALKADLRIPGEIDLLVADEHGRIWVAEVKDHGRTLSASAMRANVRDYTERDGYFGKLERKVDAVREQLAQTCELLGIDPTARRQVRGVFVSSLPETAAFLHSPRALFVLVDDFADLLLDPYPPSVGHYRVGTEATTS
jgi:hypothetical protein